MNDADATNLIGRYASSYYRDGILSPCTASDVQRSKVAIQQPGALLEAIRENGEQAKLALEYVTKRFRNAQDDGLFEIAAIECTSKALQPRWLSAIDTQRGDLTRAKSELAHWREYYTWARKNPDFNPISVRELAERKSA